MLPPPLQGQGRGVPHLVPPSCHWKPFAQVKLLPEPQIGWSRVMSGACSSSPSFLESSSQYGIEGSCPCCPLVNTVPDSWQPGAPAFPSIPGKKSRRMVNWALHHGSESRLLPHCGAPLYAQKHFLPLPLIVYPVTHGSGLDPAETTTLCSLSQLHDFLPCASS